MLIPSSPNDKRPKFLWTIFAIRKCHKNQITTTPNLLTWLLSPSFVSYPFSPLASPPWVQCHRTDSTISPLSIFYADTSVVHCDRRCLPPISAYWKRCHRSPYRILCAYFAVPLLRPMWKRIAMHCHLYPNWPWQLSHGEWTVIDCGIHLWMCRRKSIRHQFHHHLDRHLERSCKKHWIAIDRCFISILIYPGQWNLSPDDGKLCCCSILPCIIGWNFCMFSALHASTVLYQCHQRMFLAESGRILVEF